MSAVIQLAQPIRLYHPENEAWEKPSSGMTLRKLYEIHLATEKRAKKTRIDYLTTLNDWERLMDDLPPSEMSRETLLVFREKLQKEKKRDDMFRSPATINKKFRIMSRLIRLCWPADSNNPGGLNLCNYFILPSRLKEPQMLPRIFTHDELNRLYHACNDQTWPRQNPAIIWKTILVVHHCCGPRTYDLLGLNWSDIDWDYKEVGAVSFQATKTAKLQRIPLNPSARKHLQKLKDLSNSDSQKVFPGFKYSNATTILRNWRKMLSTANILDDPHMEDMRKTCNTFYNEMWPGVGDWILGHGLYGVNAKNYFNPTSVVLKAVSKLPRPMMFDSL